MVKVVALHVQWKMWAHCSFNVGGSELALAGVDSSLRLALRGVWNCVLGKDKGGLRRLEQLPVSRCKANTFKNALVACTMHRLHV